MFEVTSHGMNFTTFLPNQAHTGNTFLLHSDSLRFSGFRNGECGGNNYVLQIFVCNIGLLHFLGRGCVQATATALHCNAGASRVAGAEHIAGWLAIEARVPDVEAESVHVPREQGRQDAEDQPQSQGRP